MTILGLHDLMTGRHEIEAVSGDRRIRGVRWTLDDRPLPARGPFAAELRLGPIPESRWLTVTAYDHGGSDLFSLTTVINPGGRALTIQFLQPLPGETVPPGSPVSTCVLAATDDPVAFATLRGADGGAVPLSTDGTPCIGGRGLRFDGRAPSQGEPTVLTVTAETASGRRAEAGILVNAPGAFMESLDVRLLERLVRVADAEGRPVLDLDPGAFRITEDGLPCPLRGVHFLGDRAARPPIRVSLVFDVSGSVQGDAFAILESATARRFLDGFFRPGYDSANVYAIADEPELWSDWSQDPGKLAEVLTRLRPRASSRTALYRTLLEALYSFQDAGLGDGGEVAARVLVLISDGFDTRGPADRTSSDDTADAARILRYASVSGVRIYPVAVRRQLGDLRRTVIDDTFLRKLAAATGQEWPREQVLEVPHTNLEVTRRALESAERNVRAWSATLEVAQAAGAAQTPSEGNGAPWSSADAKRMLSKAQRARDRAGERLRRVERQVGTTRHALEAHAEAIWTRIEQDLLSLHLVVFEGRASRTRSFHTLEIALREPHRDLTVLRLGGSYY